MHIFRGFVSVAGRSALQRTGRHFVEALEGRSYLSGITFGAPVPTSGIPGGVIDVADFDGDGRPDVLTAAADKSVFPVAFQVFHGNIDGTFTAGPVSPLTPTGQNSVRLTADLNGDGKLDVIVRRRMNFGSGEDEFTEAYDFYAGNGDGTFQAATDTHIPQIGLTTAVGDINRDGKVDALFGFFTTASEHIEFYPGNGDGTFGQLTETTLPADLILKDFNGDGKLDSAAALSIDGVSTMIVFQAGNGDGTFTAFDNGIVSIAAPANARLVSTTAGDVNSDGKPDFVVVFNSGIGTGPSEVRVLLNNGSGSFTFASTLSGAGFDYSKAVIADFDGDGQADLAAARSSATRFDVFSGNGDGTFQPAEGFKGESTPELRVVDVNADAKPDLFLIASTSAVVLSGQTGGATTGDGLVHPDLLATVVTTPPATAVGTGTGKVTVDVKNIGALTFSAAAKVELFASPDATLDDSDLSLGSPVTAKLKLKTNAHHAVALKIVYPAAANGPYFVLARVTAPAGVIDGDPTNDVGASRSQVNLSPASTDLSATITPPAVLAGKKGTVVVTINNTGNVVASGTISLQLSASQQPSLDSATPLASLPTKKIKLKAGGRVVIKLKVNPSTLAPGAYYLLAQLTSTLTPVIDSNAVNDLSITAGTIAVSA